MLSTFYVKIDGGMNSKDDVLNHPHGYDAHATSKNISSIFTSQTQV